jgi:hypothetical protein
MAHADARLTFYGHGLLQHPVSPHDQRIGLLRL